MNGVLILCFSFLSFWYIPNFFHLISMESFLNEFLLFFDLIDSLNRFDFSEYLKEFSEEFLEITEDILSKLLFIDLDLLDIQTSFDFL